MLVEVTMIVGEGVPVVVNIVMTDTVSPTIRVQPSLTSTIFISMDRVPVEVHPMTQSIFVRVGKVPRQNMYN
jgi:hypothetical protein